MESPATHDPVTLEIIQNSMIAISDEMFAAMRKTAMSAIIYEVLDMGTGITDAVGEIASSGAGIPAFVGVLDKSVKAILRKHPVATIRAGDVFATNDPFYGGVTHLNDVILAMPVMDDGEIIAWTANIAHWNDLGGMVPGGMSTEATELFQEGLRLPAIKLIDAGTPIQPVFEILACNSRLPDFLRGDLWAGIAAVRLGERRLKELCAKYGRLTFLAAMAAFMDYGEERTLAGLRTLPEGIYSVAEEQDSGLIYKATIEITADRFIVDLTDNPPQVKGPSNASRDGAIISAQMALKAVTDPAFIANGGTFRPLVVKTRPGTVFDAMEPAAHGFYYEVEMRLFDLLLKCLAQVLPDRFSAGHFASICGTVFGGPHPDTKRHYTVVEPEMGGWGASLGRDGNNAIFSGFHGETFNCPAEVAEARYGVSVDCLSLNPTQGGDGKWRGGKGIRIDYRIRADNNFLTVGYSRSRILPWGLAGGRDGTANYVEVIRTNGDTSRHAFATGIPLDTGDVIRVTTGNGAGYGDPRDRDRQALKNDLKNGYISVDQARDVYGFDGEA
jgi:N-methylhydantoinase B